MACAACEFVFYNLREELVYRSRFLFLTMKDAKNKIENLQRDVDVLNDNLKKMIKNENTMQLVREIQYVVDEVENTVDTFDAVQKRYKSISWRHWKNRLDVDPIRIKIEDLLRRSTYNLPINDEDVYEPPPFRSHLVVGFEDVTLDIMRRLTQQTDYFDVIPVIGMFGSGKTSLAWKIFKDWSIEYEFPICIWLTVSQRFSYRDINLQILKKFITLNDRILAKADYQLADLAVSYLERERFLIILDDVWNTADWDRLQEALPKDNAKGKVLITSRITEVGRYASRGRPLYNLRLFTSKESWELLRLEAVGKQLDCPSELEVVGREIAKSCDGLPLAITAIGHILAKGSSSDLNQTRHYWEKVSRYVNSYPDVADSMKKSISLSYEELPYNLRRCFLYFGLFPKGYEIRVSKLIRMWIGEGFVQQHRERSLEETAESYLEDLINRNLVESCKVGPDGSVKTCRVHVTLRYFCQTEAANENFLQEIKFQSNGEFVHPTSGILDCRRLSLSPNCLEFISTRPLIAPRVRSFVSFSNENYIGSLENSIIGFFKLLRVLDVRAFKFTKIESDIYDLFHLRYIALSTVLSVLPTKFNQLWNIQTLIVDTTCPTLKVEADIWKMRQLRHFKTNASATLPQATKSGKYSSELQTLGFISVESCTAELFQRAQNLRELGIRGKLPLLFEGRSGSLDSLRKVKLEKLKLINDSYPKPRWEGILIKSSQFPSGLTSLTLSGTFLSWKHMSTLGSLEKLEVLKLKDNAFSGNFWGAVGAAFERLLLLHIEDTDLVVWKASANHYPSLRSLVLKYCEKLRGIPAELAEIPSLQKLELYNCIYAAKSAKEISDAKKRTLAAFMLSIFPSIE
ncbi:putative late blight resistance protein R1A-3 [Salvia divinorum]|uniref:Late blight resistance protein R1A-3 n=1 Tax=Salvia divinorum TaxID=28513 RepID=A0ABD1GVX1_SALDI